MKIVPVFCKAPEMCVNIFILNLIPVLFSPPHHAQCEIKNYGAILTANALASLVVP